jgi:hypothetical protein
VADLEILNKEKRVALVQEGKESEEERLVSSLITQGLNEYVDKLVSYL